MRDTEFFYLKRLETVLFFQSKMIIEDKHLTDEEKNRQLAIIQDIMNYVKEQEAKAKIR